MPIHVPYSADPESLCLVPTIDESQSSPSHSDRFYKNPLPDSHGEWLTLKVYRSAPNLQEAEARQLVDQYGKQAVGQALGGCNISKNRAICETLPDL